MTDEPLTVYVVTVHDPLVGDYEDVSMHRRSETACQRAKELLEEGLESYRMTGREHGDPMWEFAQDGHQTLRVNDAHGDTIVKYLITPVEVEP